MDDTISRQAAIDILYDFAGCIVDTPNDDYHKAYKAYRHRLEMLPSAQPERNKGKWLIRRGISAAQCSECKMYFKDVYDMDNSDAFCRHCGAKMEGLTVIEDERSN